MRCSAILEVSDRLRNRNLRLRYKLEARVAFTQLADSSRARQALRPRAQGTESAWSPRYVVEWSWPEMQDMRLLRGQRSNA